MAQRILDGMFLNGRRMVGPHFDVFAFFRL